MKARMKTPYLLHTVFRIIQECVTVTLPLARQDDSQPRRFRRQCRQRGRVRMGRAVQIAPADFLMRPWPNRGSERRCWRGAQWPVASGLLVLAMRSTRNRMNCSRSRGRFRAGIALWAARSTLTSSRLRASMSIGRSAMMRISHERRVVATVRPRHGQPRVTAPV
jgi:hypothetical protein